MKNPSRRRGLALATACTAMVAAIALVVTTSGATAAPGAVRLHLAGDGKYFAYGSTTQSLSNSSGCKLSSSDSLVKVTTGSGTYAGLGSYGLGVKTGSSNGTPCSQVDKYETLKLSRGTGLGTRKFTGVRLDVEMTGNAVVKVVLSSSSKSETYLLKTGTSIIPSEADDPDYDTTAPYMVSSGPGDLWDACAAPNASGPNSGGNDNCLWTIQPGFSFDNVSITTLKGTVALEGAGDFGGSSDFETLLYLDNSAPTANNDSFSTAEDTTLTGNVVTNDSDPDGNPLTASLVSGPADGTLSFNPNGSFSYVPDADWNGTDSFTYRVSDGTSTSNTATATITVTPVNDPPVASTEGATTQEDTEVTVPVGTDIDSPELETECTYPEGSTFSDNGDGTVQFTPPPDVYGDITLTCTVSDGESSTPASALVVVGVVGVNDPPVAVADEAGVNEGSSVSIDVVDNDLDVDGDELSVAAGNIDDIQPAGATAVGDGSGNVTYTPPSGFSGQGGFTYRATDGEATSDPAQVTVDVFQVICTTETVTDEDGDVSGTFTRLQDEEVCKRYDLDANQVEGGQVIFDPEGGSTVTYRGVLTFPGDAPPDPELGGEYPLLLRYDPTGGTTFQPVQWCIAPGFDDDGLVESATLPGSETWCVAAASTVPDGDGNLVTTWQVYGEDDPRFTR